MKFDWLNVEIESLKSLFVGLLRSNKDHQLRDDFGWIHEQIYEKRKKLDEWTVAGTRSPFPLELIALNMQIQFFNFLKKKILN